MIKSKNYVKKKDLAEILDLLLNLKDFYRDFYITKDNVRLFIKDNFDVVLRDLKKGDRILWNEHVLAFVVGFADKNPRKYLKIVGRNLKEINRFLNFALKWNIPKVDLYAKMKKANKIVSVLQKNGFQIIGDRGREYLLCRKVKK